MFKKQRIYVIATLLLLIIVIFSVLVFSGSDKVTTEPFPGIPIFSPPPSSSPFQPSVIQPILTREVPLIPEAEGGGVDLNSSLVQQSRIEIAKILPLLPYQTSLQTSTGETASILIPGAQYQETPWVLDVQVFNVDYQVTEAEPNYAHQKDLFLTAASNIFSWMEKSGISPQKIIINWGDKTYIRERAEKWLSE